MSRAGTWFLRAAGGKFGYLLIAMVALLLSAPLIAQERGSSFLLAVFASAVLVASLYAARPERRALAIGLALALVNLGLGRLVHIEGASWLVVLQAAMWLSTLLFVTVTILGAVFERERVDIETLQAGVCVYLLLGLIWVHLFALLALVAPDSFRFQGGSMIAWSDELSRWTEYMRLLIFSYSTLTTTGYGDLAPASGFATICANLETLSGQVYLAVVIARLVGVQASQRVQTIDNIQ